MKRWIWADLLLLSVAWRQPAPVHGQERPPELAAQMSHLGRIHAVSFSPDGRILASAGSDNTVRLWDPARGLQIRALEGHTGEVRAVAFSPDGKSLASASHDHSIRIWEVESGRLIRSFTEDRSFWVTSVAFGPDGKSVISATRLTDGVMNAPRLPDTTGVVTIWDLGTGRRVRTVASSSARPASCSKSPRARRSPRSPGWVMPSDWPTVPRGLSSRSRTLTASTSGT